MRLLAIAIPPRPPSFERDDDPGADASDAVWLGASDDGAREGTAPGFVHAADELLTCKQNTPSG